MKVIGSLLILLTSINHSLAASWVIKDVGHGIKPTIALDTNNVVHVSYLTEASLGVVFHAEYNEATDLFVEDTVAKGYFYGPADIEIDNTNKPHVSFHDHTLNGGDLSHFVLNNSSWDPLPVPSSGHDGWDSEIAFDSNNQTHIASIDPQIGAPGNGVEYAV